LSPDVAAQAEEAEQALGSVQAEMDGVLARLQPSQQAPPGDAEADAGPDGLNDSFASVPDGAADQS
jgi:hypothetical protein